jgi:hypothetical protein
LVGLAISVDIVPAVAVVEVDGHSRERRRVFGAHVDAEIRLRGEWSEDIPYELNDASPEAAACREDVAGTRRSARFLKWDGSRG